MDCKRLCYMHDLMSAGISLSLHHAMAREWTNIRCAFRDFAPFYEYIASKGDVYAVLPDNPCQKDMPSSRLPRGRAKRLSLG